MALIWFGNRIKDKWLEAARQAIDETMADCVNTAKPLTPVRTGTLQGSERFEPAEVKGDEVVGEWGSFDVNYAIYVETGSRGRFGRYMLRQAADQHYPELKENIRRRYDRSI